MMIVGQELVAGDVEQPPSHAIVIVIRRQKKKCRRVRSEEYGGISAFSPPGLDRNTKEETCSDRPVVDGRMVELKSITSGLENRFGPWFSGK